jgi:hypothetical protein
MKTSPSPLSRFLLLSLSGAFAGSLVSTSWLLFEFLPEIVRSIDALSFAFLLVGPPTLLGVVSASLIARNSVLQYPRFVFLVAALTSLLSGIVVAAWWFHRLANV